MRRIARESLLSSTLTTKNKIKNHHSSQAVTVDIQYIAWLCALEFQGYLRMFIFPPFLFKGKQNVESHQNIPQEQPRSAREVLSLHIFEKGGAAIRRGKGYL